MRDVPIVSLESQEGLRLFQSNELPERDQEWHRLVPPEARNVLDRLEVTRQSIIFEIIKSERDYVNDLQLVKDVFIDPLINTAPVREKNLRGFVSEVFNNLDRIREHHRRMLGSLFARQRDQHPLIQSVADIILEASLLFVSEYEIYIKNYPFAEARHRTELKNNAKYQYFIEQCMHDPRIRKREFITFISRPVTRLPRLRLLLENSLKHTAPDHDDVKELPLILDILKQFVRSTEPGIAAAEDKVKFWELCESLTYHKGEIIDLDLYDESRSLVYAGPLARRYRPDPMVYSWADLHVALLDNYLLLLKPETRQGGTVRRSVVSRPIPLEYLRLASFSEPAEMRKEKVEEGGLFDRFRTRDIPMFPFTIYHASDRTHRRYTLYAANEAIRSKWNEYLVDAAGVRKVRQEANMWFAPHVINEGFFKSPESILHSSGSFTGRILSAAPLSSMGRSFVAVGCPAGVYVAARGEADYRHVLHCSNATELIALPEHNKFLVLSDSGLCSYPLDFIARIALGHSSVDLVESMKEIVIEPGETILCLRAGRIGHRRMILYVTKQIFQVTFQALEVVNPDASGSTRRNFTGLHSFRHFHESLTVRQDIYHLTVLHRNAGICMDKGIWIVDPTNLKAAGSESATIIPNFSGAESSPPLNTLRTRCASAKPLGLVHCEEDELLVVYDELGCYINHYGVPIRSSGYLRWESKATSFAHRGDHLLLFSFEFIEIRTLKTGKLVQVIESNDIRLVYKGLLSADNTILVAMKAHTGRGSVVDKIVELVETSELMTPRTASVSAAWEEWDM
ncbi:hypothetical protein WOLCODRAFT_25360 [Wolfiporia cocos MD-104 SS10]|uniref:Dbl homology domain-containing protein n=1 Tax=Wolfiporia cocos (strain MD-104) TaxID=742152 RepID=A0A2H3JJP8_WOLCO|nr:hypothetical protein WOLCODRAFT_25360 [Wolfiporia cocos MD-104 SS10]